MAAGRAGKNALAWYVAFDFGNRRKGIPPILFFRSRLSPNTQLRRSRIVAMIIAPTKAAIPRSHAIEFGIVQLPDFGVCLLRNRVSEVLIRVRIGTADSGLSVRGPIGLLIFKC